MTSIVSWSKCHMYVYWNPVHILWCFNLLDIGMCSYFILYESVSLISWRYFLFVPCMSSCFSCCLLKNSRSCNCRQRSLHLPVSIHYITTCTLHRYGGLQWHSTPGAWSLWSRGLLVNWDRSSASLMPIHSRYFCMTVCTYNVCTMSGFLDTHIITPSMVHMHAFVCAHSETHT